MKNTDKLSDLSNEELMKKLKVAKTIYVVFFAVFIIMLATCLYLTYSQGFSVFTMLPICFIPIMIANIMSYGKVREEARSRKLM